jgi:hypothetical protein
VTLIVLDDCQIGVGPEPSGGLTISLKIEGFPSAVLPLDLERAEKFYAAIGDVLKKPKVHIATEMPNG